MSIIEWNFITVCIHCSVSSCYEKRKCYGNLGLCFTLASTGHLSPSVFNYLHITYHWIVWKAGTPEAGRTVGFQICSGLCTLWSPQFGNLAASVTIDELKSCIWFNASVSHHRLSSFMVRFICMTTRCKQPPQPTATSRVTDDATILALFQHNFCNFVHNKFANEWNEIYLKSYLLTSTCIWQCRWKSCRWSAFGSTVLQFGSVRRWRLTSYRPAFGSMLLFEHHRLFSMLVQFICITTRCKQRRYASQRVSECLSDIPAKGHWIKFSSDIYLEPYSNVLVQYVKLRPPAARWI